MTKDDADTILYCESPYSNSSCGASDEEKEEAFNMAMAALRAIQDIEYIINLEDRVDVIKYKLICEIIERCNKEDGI